LGQKAPEASVPQFGQNAIVPPEGYEPRFQKSLSYMASAHEGLLGLELFLEPAISPVPASNEGRFQVSFGVTLFNDLGD
jgi:hypothetical protein